MFSFDHICLSIKDVDASVKFYKKLNFKPFKRWDAPDGNLSIVQMKNDSVVLEMFCYKVHKPLPKYRKLLSTDLETIGTKHFGLCVKDVNKTAEHLTSIGLCKLPEIKKGRLGRDYFFIEDPDGILVEIIESEK